MMKKHKFDEKWTDEVGFVGIGKVGTNTDSEDFKKLKKIIDAEVQKQTPAYRRQLRFESLKLQMKTYIQEKDAPFRSIGAFLKEHLEILDITNKAFAKYLKIEASNLSAILRGKRKVSLDLAVKLGRLFEANAELWLGVQNKNELLLLKKKFKEKYKKISVEDLLKKAS